MFSSVTLVCLLVLFSLLDSSTLAAEKGRYARGHPCSLSNKSLANLCMISISAGPVHCIDLSWVWSNMQSSCLPNQHWLVTWCIVRSCGLLRMFACRLNISRAVSSADWGYNRNHISLIMPAIVFLLNKYLSCMAVLNRMKYLEVGEVVIKMTHTILM